MRKCGVISSRAADAVIVSTEIRRDHTRRRRPPSTQTLLLGRLLGLVGVYGGRRPTRRRDGRACTCSLLRPSALLRMLVAWGRASQTPESTHNAYTRGARWGGVEPLQSCVSASGSAADARFFFFFFFFFSEPSSDLARFFDGFVSVGRGRVAVLRPPRSAVLARAARALREGSRLDERRPPRAPLSARRAGDRRRRSRRSPSGAGPVRVSPRLFFLAAASRLARESSQDSGF